MKTETTIKVLYVNGKLEEKNNYSIILSTNEENSAYIDLCIVTKDGLVGPKVTVYASELTTAIGRR